jgi:peptidoglycan hydrolase-like protein with peptidoglycan-binding domain
MNQIRKLCRPGRLVLVLCMSLLSACTNEFRSEAPATTVSGSSAIEWKARASAEQVTRAQSLLSELGFKPGPVDGKEGPMTAAAVREYQSAAGLPGDGQVSNLLVDHIAKAVETRQVVRAQRRLIDLGYDAGPIDGTAGPRTRSAVEAFQEATGGAKDGRITPQLLAALDAAGASSGGQPRDGQPRDGQPRDGQPRDGQPRDGQPRDGQPRDGRPRSG